MCNSLARPPPIRWPPATIRFCQAAAAPPPHPGAIYGRIIQLYLGTAVFQGGRSRSAQVDAPLPLLHSPGLVLPLLLLLLPMPMPLVLVAALASASDSTFAAAASASRCALASSLHLLIATELQQLLAHAKSFLQQFFFEIVLGSLSGILLQLY